jgi:hypothetical protein
MSLSGSESMAAAQLIYGAALSSRLRYLQRLRLSTPSLQTFPLSKNVPFQLWSEERCSDDEGSGGPVAPVHTTRQEAAREGVGDISEHSIRASLWVHRSLHSTVSRQTVWLRLE